MREWYTMKICKICCCPEDKCQCAQQGKNAWLWEHQASLEEWMEQCKVQIRNLQDEIEIFRTYPEEKAKLDYHRENSFGMENYQNFF